MHADEWIEFSGIILLLVVSLYLYPLGIKHRLGEPISMMAAIAPSFSMCFAVAERRWKRYKLVKNYATLPLVPL